MLTVSHLQPAIAIWYQFYCLVNRDTIALVACPELLVRKLVELGIEPATLRSPGRNLNHAFREDLNKMVTWQTTVRGLSCGMWSHPSPTTLLVACKQFVTIFVDQ